MKPFAYTEEQRAAITAALPAFADAAQVIVDLESAATDYVQHDAVESRAKHAAIRDKYQRLSTTLASARDHLKEMPPADPLWPGFDRAAALEQIDALRMRSDELASIGGELLSLYGSKQDPFRDLLCEVVMRAWVTAGGKLTLSRGGPLMRFMDAALRPILRDQTPGTERLYKIIQQERTRRGQFART